ncbi:hypothetical protein BV25DRAFT_1324841 [Artomyces pyxidatus]|uniref:Uncharacterized protein n=1 Tax=Artomyces pyxidatus TaxID=48021 RepID=A0ACB8SNA9_9AGAM|nr:hypothetical protein BV25DRAFT_1324841 [Artomyces pyxidatus]
MALRYSNPRPISIYVDYASLEILSYRDMVILTLENLWRARDLSLGAFIECPEKEVVLKLMKLLAYKPAPKLQSLTLSFDQDSEIIIDEECNPIFCGEPQPNLRILILWRAALTRQHHFFGLPLTVLELKDCSIGTMDAEGQYAGNIDDLLCVLDSLSTLRRLILREHRVSGDLTPSFSSHSIVLPALESLEIVDRHFKTMEVLMDCLLFPDTVELHLCDNTPHPPSLLDRASRLQAVVLKYLHYRLAAGLSFHSLAVEVERVQCGDLWTFAASTAPTTPPPIGDDIVDRRGWHQRIRVSICTDYDPDATTLPTLLQLLPATHAVRTFSIVSWPYPLARAWLDVLAGFSQITRINVPAHCVHALLYGLTGSLYPHSTICPRLRTVCSQSGVLSDAGPRVNRIVSYLAEQRMAAVPLQLPRYSQPVTLDFQPLRTSLGVDIRTWDERPLRW